MSKEEVLVTHLTSTVNQAAIETIERYANDFLDGRSSNDVSNLICGVIAMRRNVLGDLGLLKTELEDEPF